MCDSRDGRGTHIHQLPLQLGTNDLAEANLTGSLAPESICGAIQQLHQVCHGHGIRTVALPIPPNKFTTLQSAEFEEYQKLWRRTNELLFAWASETPQTVWFDVTKELPWSETDGCWEADGLHLAPAGSEKLGNLLGSHPMVRQWLLEGCAPLLLFRLPWPVRALLYRQAPPPLSKDLPGPTDGVADSEPEVHATYLGATWPAEDKTAAANRVILGYSRCRTRSCTRSRGRIPSCRNTGGTAHTRLGPSDCMHAGWAMTPRIWDGHGAEIRARGQR